jgi:hypothetical protein
MKPPELDRLLQRGQVPERPEAYWDDFPTLVIRRLQGDGVPAQERRTWRLGAALAVAAACGLVVGFALWHRSRPMEVTDAGMRDGRVLREFLAQYPGRLQAIVRDGTGVHAQLSAAAAVSTSDPIWIEIREGNALRVIATFSGQMVQCGGKNVMVLSDGAGQVMLVGDGFFWSSQISAGVAGDVRILARQIPNAQPSPRPTMPL